MMEFFIEFARWSPFGIKQGLIGIIILSFVITFALTLVYKYTTNQKEMKELKERQKKLQEEIKSFRENPEKLKELNQEMMQISAKMIKHSFKPMIFTFIPIIIIFALLKNLYSKAQVGNIIYWGKNLPLVGDGAGWFLCYIIFGFIFSIILRKIMKVH